MNKEHQLGVYNHPYFRRTTSLATLNVVNIPIRRDKTTDG